RAGLAAVEVEHSSHGKTGLGVSRQVSVIGDATGADEDDRARLCGQRMALAKRGRQWGAHGTMLTMLSIRLCASRSRRSTGWLVPVACASRSSMKIGRASCRERV